MSLLVFLLSLRSLLGFIFMTTPIHRSPLSRKMGNYSNASHAVENRQFPEARI